jgi:phosphate transport system protein
MAGSDGSTSITNYEKLGAFYLGKRFDLKDGETTNELILYDANDLTTHAVCVGMTGSGKTGLCVGLLEEALIDGDNEIDGKEIEVEDECLKVLALHQPVATDLRYIIAVLKVNNSLERIGDMAVNIAERAVYLTRRDPIPLPPEFSTLVDKVQSMVKKSLDALVNRDTGLAREVCRMDDEVDAYHERMWEFLLERMSEDPTLIKRGSNTLSLSYQLERIADVATNIAEDVVFMVEGEVIRHPGLGKRAQGGKS